MSNLNSRDELAVEMAAISAVKSLELVELSKGTLNLSEYQTDLSETKDRVQMVKSTLQATEDHAVTPALATTLDTALARSEVVIPATNDLDEVEGAEALGITLMPSQYRLTRLQGCESFMSDFFNKSREITIRIASQFKEGYILFTESQDSLERAIDHLEQQLNTVPTFDNKVENIRLGSRLFNLFQVNGKVSEDWAGDLTKLSRTIAGLSNNYYLNNKNALQATLSYFGGFADLSEEQAKERLLMLPISIPSDRFKECSYPARTKSISTGTAKQSVELMGGAYFVDIRQDKPAKQPKTILEMEQYLERMLEVDRTYFENNAEVVFPKIGNEIKSFSSPKIKLIIKLLREVMKEWRKVFEGGERYKLAESDYVEITRGIYESNLTEETKDKVLHAFSTLVRKNQMELMSIRSAVNNYLTLIINGLIELSYDSIKVNTPEE